MSNEPLFESDADAVDYLTERYMQDTEHDPSPLPEGQVRQQFLERTPDCEAMLLAMVWQRGARIDQQESILRQELPSYKRPDLGAKYDAAVSMGRSESFTAGMTALKEIREEGRMILAAAQKLGLDRNLSFQGLVSKLGITPASVSWEPET